MTARARATLLMLLLSGCIASNVVAPEQRMVVEDLSALAWQPATAELQLDGLYETVDVRGQAAASLRKVYYVFTADGTYTGAALTESDGTFAFQTIQGTWRRDGEWLVLDDAEPVRLEQAEGHVRIVAPTGTIVMQRQELR